MNDKLKVWIPMEDCVDSQLYIIFARNARVGVYNEEKKCFVISRHKFNTNFIDYEYHWDTGIPFGTAKPIKLCGYPGKFYDNNELLEFLNKEEHALKPDYFKWHLENFEI